MTAARLCSKGPPPDDDHDPGFVRSVQGQLLRYGGRREVAIFLRKGTLWVADFIDGEGFLVDATTWFRFNCATLSATGARRRMVLESAVPLSADLVKRIECLHAATAQHRRGEVAQPASTTRTGAFK